MRRVQDFFKRNWEGMASKLIYDIIKWMLLLLFGVLSAFIFSREWDLLELIPKIGTPLAFFTYLCVVVGMVAILYQTIKLVV